MMLIVGVKDGSYVQLEAPSGFIHGGALTQARWSAKIRAGRKLPSINRAGRKFFVRSKIYIFDY